jgi:hypothetical protein
MLVTAISKGHQVFAQGSTSAVGCNIFGIVLISALCGISAHGDSWLPAREFNTVSENGQFVARVIPATTNSKPLIVVSAIKGPRTNELWRATLSNKTCPVTVYLWDEGTGLVTLDNWGAGGYGNDVVAFYGPNGQKASYSLEQLAPPDNLSGSGNETSSLLANRRAFDGKFPHSTSSRHWRRNSLYFFYQHAGEVLFCLWLDWDNRWLVWQLSDGKLRQVPEALATSLNTEGRMRALQHRDSRIDAHAALDFLGRLRHSEDRPLIEARLRDRDFFTGSRTTYSSEATKPSFCFTAYSSKRQEADHILSRWDDRTTETSAMGNSEHYHFLGTVSGRIILDAAPKKGEGTLRLYLIPESIPLEKWSETQPEHYLIADLLNNFPTMFEEQTTKNFPLTKQIAFEIYGVTPDNYRLKAVWNKTPPWTQPDTAICIPHDGDFESIRSPVISVKKGQIADGINLECKQRSVN